MQKFDNDKLLNIEGWSFSDRNKAVQWSLLTIVVGFLGSLGLVIVPWIYFSLLPSWLLIVVAMSGCVGLVVSFITMTWQRHQSEIHTENENQLDDTSLSQHPYMDFIIASSFSVNGLMLCLNALFFMFTMVQFQFDRDYFNATSDVNETADFFFRFKLTGCLIVILLFINSLAFSFNVFAIYISSTQQEHMRVAIHVFNFTVLLSVLFVIYAAKHCLSFEKSPMVSSLVQLHYIKITVIVAIVITIVCLLIYAINLSKSKVGYFFIGSALLCIVFINATVHFKVFRDAQNIREHFINDCGNQLRNTPEQFLKDDCYCQKYEKTLDCPASQLAVHWEDNNNVNVEQQLNHQACLNLNCCGTLSDAYSKWFYALAFGSVSLQVFGFGLIGVLYYIAQQPPFVSYKLYFSDLIFGGLITITLIVGIILFYAKDFQAVPPQNVTLSEFAIQMPSNCLPLYMVQPSTFSCDNCDQVRISLYSQKADFQQSKLFHDSDKIKQIPSSLAAKEIFNADDNDSVMSLQGSLANVVEGYKYVTLFKLIEKVYFCPNSFSSSIDVLLDFYILGEGVSQQMQLSTNVATPAPVIKAAPSNTTKKISLATLPLASLNQIPFTNIEVSAVDTFKQKNLSNFTAKLYVGSQLYLSLDSIDQQVVFYNIPLKVYTLEVSNDGYFTVSKELVVDQNSKVTEANVQMVPKLSDEGQLLFLLEWEDPTVQLGLASTFKQSETVECTSGLILGTCDTMNFQSSNSSSSQIQTIMIDGVKDQKYLIYVQYFPRDKSEIQANQDSQDGKSLTDSEVAAVDNSNFFKSGIKLSVYGYGTQKPLLSMSGPLEADERHEPNLTWLALCLDGKVGVNSLSSPANQEFWNYVQSADDQPEWYERNFQDQRALPTGVLCDKFYQSLNQN